MKNKNFIYNVYGLNISSELELPELISGGDECINSIDVKIHYGKVPQEVKEKIKETVCVNIDRNNICVYVKDIAIYQVLNGNEIIIEPLLDTNKERIKSFLLGWSFGVLFVQRNTIALHGSAMVRDGKAFIIAGQSQAGKSTLAAALKLKGYKFLSDDVSTIDMDVDDILMINPAYPQQKLCKDTMEKLEYNTNEYEINRKKTGRERFKIPMEDCFLDESLPINSIFQIVVKDTDSVKIEEIKGSEKMDCLLENVYFICAERHLGMRPEYFKKCLKIVKNIPFFRIIRSDGEFTVKKQIEEIELVLNKL